MSVEFAGKRRPRPFEMGFGGLSRHAENLCDVGERTIFPIEQRNDVGLTVGQPTNGIPYFERPFGGRNGLIASVADTHEAFGLGSQATESTGALVDHDSANPTRGVVVAPNGGPFSVSFGQRILGQVFGYPMRPGQHICQPNQFSIVALVVAIERFFGHGYSNLSRARRVERCRVYGRESSGARSGRMRSHMSNTFERPCEGDKLLGFLGETGRFLALHSCCGRLCSGFGRGGGVSNAVADRVRHVRSRS